MSNLGKSEKQRILLIGNSKQDEKLLSKILSENFDVISADNEDNAIEIIADSSKKIAMAIIYIEAALSILQRIRIIPLLENFPVLITTDIPNSNLEDKLLELDAIDFLKKPFNDRRVLNRVKTAVKLAEANKVIRELERDELTGLLSRRAFLRKAELERSKHPEKQRGAVCVKRKKVFSLPMFVTFVFCAFLGNLLLEIL